MGHPAVYQSIENIVKEEWDSGFNSLPMKYDVLKPLELSRINNIEHYYLLLSNSKNEPIGRANLHLNITDFSTFDSELDESFRKTLKTLDDSFMTFRILECGFFTMIGMGVEVKNNEDLPKALDDVMSSMAEISQTSSADFSLIRDIPVDVYQENNDLFKKHGYLPALGFPNTYIDIKWESFDDYLMSLNSKTRLKFKNSLKLEEKFGVRYEFTNDYSDIAETLEQLWSNVNQSASDYSREILDKEFFLKYSSLPNNEVLLFKYEGKIIGFMFCIYDDTEYVMLDWGVDYSFPHYEKANLYRAASALCLKSAIDKSTSIFELGITNYTPKLTLGAAIEPLIYLIKHNKNPDFTRAMAKVLSESIRQPEGLSHDTSKRLGYDEIDFKSLKDYIANEQNPYPSDDIFRKCGEYTDSAFMKLANLYGLYPEFHSGQGSSVIMSGGKRTVLLGTNSYLSAATDPRVIEASINAIKKYGTGCSGSPLMNGTLDIHNNLECELAEFTGKESVMLCSTGYQTNLAAIDGLCAHGDLIVMDARNHRSLFDAARMSGADYVVYRHNDMAHLRKTLERNKGRRTLIVADSLFSMEGNIADLETICALAEEFNARTFIDESHAIGVLGQNGRGICELLGVEEKVDLIMGTFSKAFASIGGFIAGKSDVIEYLKHNSGPHIFSASLPPASIAAIRMVLEIIQSEPEARADILEKAKFMADALSSMGYRAAYKGTQIVPVAFGSFEIALAAYKSFKDRGVFVNPIGPPAVPVNDAGFRTSYMSGHQWDDLHAALDVFNGHKSILIN